ncbi:MAG TPA: sarcosine oxidase subunit alpha family protein [Stellaceae bacterium]|nr:sarcosine oxidase subunit alpha family protein [Stellaceae bacterium]
MPPQPFRLPQGGRIDRSRSLAFTFNGRRYDGHPGDTLASALLANGVALVARSFKYHRPRGVMSAGAEEACAFVQLGEGARSDPNCRATQIELFDGLTAASLNCWPNVQLDFGVVSDRLHRLLPAGFYYKTFMWPRRGWLTYEKLIRRAAGLGRAPSEPDPDRYEKRFAHADLLIAGGGPAGLAAALAAGRTGARVILADENGEFGGQLLWRDAEIDGEPALRWVERSLAELSSLPEVRLLPRSTVAGYYDHNFLTVLERVTDHLSPFAAPTATPRQRLWKVRARQVVLATGAIERPLVFINNDLPGIMLAGAAQAYIRRHAVRPGGRAVIFTNNDSAYETVAALSEAGVAITAVIDARAGDTAAAEACRRRGIEVLRGHAVIDASGGHALREVTVAPLDGSATALAGAASTLRCDLLCVSGGWSPTVHLFSQSGGKLAFDAASGCFIPGESRQAERSAGAARGSFDLAACLAEGHAAGLAAARAAGFAGPDSPPPQAPAQAMSPIRPLWEVPSPHQGRRDRKFVDLQNDVTAADIALAAREGYRSVEHTKRYTTAGMGVDQGKTGNLNTLAILAGETQGAIPAVGTTTFRPPYTPVTIGALAGRGVGDFYDPVRKTPMSPWHEARGAVFEPVGKWRRPLYYPGPGEGMEAAVRRECLAVRNAVGLCDASTLGKIDIKGRDAVTLLDRVYTNSWGSLAIGRCRYGLMLKDDGMVFDDGVTTRLGERHYLMTTTSGHAEAVFGWLEEWLQCEWLGLDVYLTSVTTHWATAMLAGPRAREVLAAAGTDIDTSRAGSPYMTVREGHVAGIPARLFRVSFTGELSFEINVPARYGLALWETLMAAGAAFGIEPIGTEALHVLRAEKGYIVVGHDTDGTVTPYDLGMGWIVDQKKPDFIGKRGLRRSDLVRTGRRQLVGLLTDDPAQIIPEGSQIVRSGASLAATPVPMLGHVTSSYWSPALQRSIAMALIEGGQDRQGEAVEAVLPDRTLRAVIGTSRFYDPEGVRLHG